jgi:hypothetical protein
VFVVGVWIFRETELLHLGLELASPQHVESFFGHRAGFGLIALTFSQMPSKFRVWVGVFPNATSARSNAVFLSTVFLSKANTAPTTPLEGSPLFPTSSGCPEAGSPGGSLKKRKCVLFAATPNFLPKRP